MRGAGGEPDNPLLGVVLAGGAGRRFGRPKALAEVGGRPMAAWACDALVANLPRVVAISDDPSVPWALGIPGRPDKVPGLGPVGGLLTALEWAREDAAPGVFLLACDLPLVGFELVGRILEEWPSAALAVVPESDGPLGFEPLCGGYAVGCLTPLQRILAGGHLALARLVEAVEAHRVPAEILGSREELAHAFWNVNTPEDADRVGEALVGRLRAVPARDGARRRP